MVLYSILPCTSGTCNGQRPPPLVKFLSQILKIKIFAVAMLHVLYDKVCAGAMMLAPQGTLKVMLGEVLLVVPPT